MHLVRPVCLFVSDFSRPAVDVRGSALSSSTKSANNHHYQSKVIVSVSVISGQVNEFLQPMLIDHKNPKPKAHILLTHRQISYI